MSSRPPADTESPDPDGRLVDGPFTVLLGAAFFSALGFSAVIPLIARYVEIGLDGGPVQVGIAVGIFSFSAVAARPYIGRLGDRRGRRVLIAGGTFLTSLVLAGHAFADTYLLLLVARLLMGAFQGAFFVGTVTIVNDMAPAHRRGEAANIFSVALYLGMAMGPAVGEAAFREYGFDWAFVISAGAMMIAALIALFLPDYIPEPGPEPAPGERRQLFHRGAIWPGAILALGIMIFPAMQGFLPALMADRDLGSFGAIFAVYGLLVLVFRLVGRKLPDTLGTSTTATVALIGSAVGMALMGAATSRIMLFAGAAVLAVGGSLLYPALMVAAVDGVPPRERAQAMSTFTMFFELSGGIGGPVLGVIVWLSGTNAGALYGAAVFAAVGVPLLRVWQGRGRPPVRTMDPVVFRILPVTGRAPVGS